MNKTERILSLYAASLLVIVATWLVTTLSHDSANLATVYSEPALRALVILVASWGALCGAHYLQSGDPTPPVPAERPPPPPPQPPPAPGATRQYPPFYTQPPSASTPFLPPQPPSTGTAASVSLTTTGGAL